MPVGTLALAKRIELHLGGCATNTAVAAARLGAKSRLIGCAGRDDLGHWILMKLLDAGVMTNGITQMSAQSGTSVILVSRNGNEQSFIVPDQTRC
jgi:ribokinase